MNSLKLSLFALLAAASSVQGAGADLPVEFEANCGQFPAALRYAARGRGGLLAIAATPAIPLAGGLRLTFPGRGTTPSQDSAWKPSDATTGKTSYRVGNDPAQWRSNIPRYRRLRWEELYPGIGLELYGANGRLEYDFVVAAGAHPENIRMRFEGASQIAVDSAGNLVITSTSGTVVQRRPVSFQKGRVVATRYRIVSAEEAALEFDAAYDREAVLTIDPIVDMLTLLGGSGDDKIIATNAYFTVGMTRSSDFPGVLSAAHQNYDVFVRNEPTGDTMIIGGSGDEIVTSAKAVGYPTFPGVIIGGYTDSQDLPTTPQSFQPNYFPDRQLSYGGGAHDGFLIYMRDPRFLDMVSYMGGSGDDRVTAVAGLGDTSIIAVGATTSLDMPLAQNGLAPPASGFVNVFGSYGSAPGTYIGGSDGIDTPLSVAVTPSKTDFYVGGEMRSSNWQPGPAWNGGITRQQGAPADAFLLHFPWTSVYAAPVVPVDAALWGGAGDDRITAIDFRSDGRLAVAGVTASSELAGYHGGATDAFALTASANLNTVSGLTLLGGGGADEASSIAINPFNETAVGGWTNSKDFALRDAIQPAYGGGPDDGFVVLLDDAGTPILATYLGGSGSDQIASVVFDSLGLQLYAGGFSTSLDMPLKNSAAASGGADGLLAVLRPAVIHARQVTVGKSLAGTPQISLGDAAKAASVAVTVSSSDTSTVVLGQLPDDPAVGSLTLTYGPAGQPQQRTFRVYCLADRGGASLAVSAPGYPSRTIPVRCVPSGIYAGPPALQVAGPTYAASISVGTAAFDPDTGLPIEFQSPRVSSPAVTVAAAISDPSILYFNSVSKLTFDNYGNTPPPQGLQLFAKSQGATDVTFTAPPGWTIYPSSTVHVDVQSGPLYMSLPAVAPGMLARIGYSLNVSSGAAPPVTFTSSDSTKVRLSASEFSAGEASITVACCTPVYLEGLDSGGPVSITASAPGVAPLRLPVRIRQASSGFIYSANTIDGPTLPAVSLNKGDKVDLRAIVWSGAPSAYTGFLTLPILRAGSATATMRIVNSNPAVVSATATSLIGWGQGGGFQFLQSLVALSSGTAVLRLESDDMSLQVEPLTITVNGPTLSVTGATIGKDLQANILVSIPVALPAEQQTVTLTSSDPSKLLISTDSTAPGQASATAPLSYSRAVFSAQALASSGDVTVTATVPGIAPVSAVVHLAPSGFAWTANSFTLTRSGDGPQLAAWALDPATLTTVVTESLRPGLTGSVAIRNSNPGAISLDTTAIEFSINVNSVALTIAAGGKTELSIDQPAGFSAPVGRRPLPVSAAPQVARFDSQGQLGVNLQLPGTVSLANGPAQMTISSSDASKLVLSTSISDLGLGSITIKRRTDGTYQPFYYQALDGPADVVVTASGDGMDTVSQTLPIAATLLQFDFPYYGLPPDGIINISTAQDPYGLNISPGVMALDDTGHWRLTNSSAVLRAGYGTLPLTVTSSQPAVAKVINNPVPFNSLTNTAIASVQALSGGTAEMTLTAPNGFRLPSPGPSRTAVFNAAGNAFSAPDVTLAKGLQVTTSVQFSANTGAPTVDVTITSSDPTAVLLSAAADTVGSGSVTLHYVPGKPASAVFYVQALTDSSGVMLQVTAPGFMATQAKVTILPVQFSADTYYLSLTPGGPTQDVHFRPGLLGLNSSSVFQFRPGLAPFEVTAFSSDATVFTLVNNTVQVKGGDAQFGFTIQPQGEGAASLTLGAAAQAVSINVRGGNLNLYNNLQSLSKDFQGSISVTPVGAGAGGTPVAITLTSSDPARVVVSGSATVAGQASATVTGSQPVFYVQALAGSGSVTLTASAAGFSNATTNLALTGNSVWLQAQNQLSTLSPLSGPVIFNVYTGNRNNNQTQLLRPGAAPVTVNVSSLDPSVGTVTPAQLIFNPGEGSKVISFQPKAPGTTLLTLSLPAGFNDVPADRQQLLTVVAPQLNLPLTTTVGKDMLKYLTVALVGQVGGTVPLTFKSSDPAKLLFLPSLSATPGQSVTLPFSNGTLALYVVGLADSGSATFEVTGAGFPAITYTVSFEPSGFYFRDSPQSATVGVGNFASRVVAFSSLTPGTLQPHEDGNLRPGAAPVSIPITSSDPAVTPDTSVVLPAGSGGVTANLLGKKPGTAVVTLNAPAGYSQPASKATLSLTVQ